MRRKDLGISSKEYDDSLTLERLFYFVSKIKCSTCMFKRPTAVDLQSLELLCDTCSSRCKNVSVIGRDNISLRTVLELEHKYNITPFNAKHSKSKEQLTPTKSKHSNRKSEKKHSKHRKNRSSNSPEPLSPIDSEDESPVHERWNNKNIYENPSQYPGMMGLMANNAHVYNPSYNNAQQPHPPYTDRHVDYNNQPRPYRYPEQVYQPSYQMQNPYQSNVMLQQQANEHQLGFPKYNIPVKVERKASNNPFSQDLHNEQQGYFTASNNMFNPYNNVHNPMQNY